MFRIGIFLIPYHEENNNATVGADTVMVRRAANPGRVALCPGRHCRFCPVQCHERRVRRIGRRHFSYREQSGGIRDFHNHEVAATLTSYNVANKSDYYGQNEKAHDNTFDLNSAGGVYVIPNDDSASKWKKLTLAVDYENIRNLDDDRYAAGSNPNHSIADYFLHYANGAASPLGYLQNSYYEDLGYADAQAFLGYQGYVIYPVAENPDNTGYVSNVPAGTYQQQFAMASTGFNGKLAFNVGAQFTDRLYFGLNLNSHFSDYTQSSVFYEENGNDAASGLQRVEFDNDLHTTGTGFSFQLGAIFKATQALRLGLTYDSPTWYKFTDEIRQRVLSDHFDADANAVISTLVDPQVTVTFAPYSLHVPGKWTGSAAYVFGKEGLISIDCALKNYSAAKFRPTGDFDMVNQDMKNQLDANAFEIRAGAEKRYKQWSFRGGYRWEESPYRNNTMGDLNGFSAGLGYNFGGMKVDFAFAHASQMIRQGIFTPAFNDAPQVQRIANNVSVSVLLDLE
jgi:hypothetical protein